MAEYIDREEAIIALLEKGQHSKRYKLGEIWELNFDEIREAINEVPAADVVEQKVLDQVYWERDTALHQLAEIGKGLGEKMDDVVERKHGKWEKHNDGIMYWWDCSECHHDAWYDEDDLYNFCPNCGADMRGEDDV